jgi:hypothetical protein
MLYACDEIAMRLFPEQGWRKTCRDHLKRHARYLCDEEITQLYAYSDSMKALIMEVVDQAPECSTKMLVYGE